MKVEVLTPDFRGEEMPLARVIAERPDVFNHNVETVPRLYPLARRGSQFLRSCRVLRNAKEMGGDEVVTKSGLMTGLGETKEELLETFGVLREHDVQVLTVGQYLRPTRDHLPVVRYWHPDEFAELEREAYAMGFESVAAGPLVRSSYHAEQTLEQAERRRCAGVTRAVAASRGHRRCSPPAAVLALPRDGGARQDRWRALPPAQLERTEVAAARIGRSSTWSAASRAQRRRPPARSSATTSARTAGRGCARCRSASTTRRPPPTAGRLYVHGGYTRPRDLIERHRRAAASTTRSATAGAGCPRRPRPARRTRWP